MNTRKWISLVLCLLLALSLAACGDGGNSGGNDSATGQTAGTAGGGSTAEATATEGQSHSFIFGTDGAEDTVNGIVASYVAQELEARTGGRIKVQLFFNGSMGTDRELLESCQQGDVTFNNSSTAFTANFVPQLNVIDLPFLYPNAQSFRATMDDPVVYETYDSFYGSNGYVLLGFYDQGMRQMTSNTLVQTAADISGQKIRTMENNFHIAIWKALGANPAPMAFAEVYIGLQQGTIDAQENPFEVIYANKIYEQQKYVVMTSHLPASHNLLISKSVFDSLSPEDQELVVQVGRDAVAYARQQCDARLAERERLVQEAGTEIITLSDEVLAELQQLTEGIYDEVRAEYGDELIDMQIAAAQANRR